MFRQVIKITISDTQTPRLEKEHRLKTFKVTAIIVIALNRVGKR